MAAILLPINSKQFESALKIRELKNCQVEEALCRSTGYISGIKKRGSINLADAKMIEAFFDIPKEEYATSIPEPKKPGVKKVKGLDIDFEQLRKAFKARGLGITGASHKIGKSHAFFDHIRRVGRISEEAMNLTKDILGIPPEEYVKKYMVKEESELPDIPIVIEDKTDPLELYVAKQKELKFEKAKALKEHGYSDEEIAKFVGLDSEVSVKALLDDTDEPHVKAATDIPTPKFSFDRNKLRVLKRPEPKEIETKKSGKFPWGESSEIIHNPDMPVFVNISINVEIKSEDSKVPEIDYRRLKSDTYNAVCTGVFDGMARWNRR